MLANSSLHLSNRLLKPLSPACFAHNWIQATPRGPIVVPGIVEVEARAVIQFLTGILVGHVGRAGVGERLAIGIVDQVFFLHPAAVGEHTGRPQMIGMEVTRGPAAHLFYGDPLTSPKDHLGAGGAHTDIELADIGRGRGADGFLHPPAIAVIHKRGRRAALGHADRPVFIVIGTEEQEDVSLLFLPEDAPPGSKVK